MTGHTTVDFASGESKRRWQKWLARQAGVPPEAVSQWEYEHIMSTLQGSISRLRREAGLSAPPWDHTRGEQS